MKILLYHHRCKNIGKYIVTMDEIKGLPIIDWYFIDRLQGHRDRSNNDVNDVMVMKMTCKYNIGKIFEN